MAQFRANRAAVPQDGHVWEAELLLKQALEIQVKTIGREDLDTTATLMDLVTLLIEQGRDDDAIHAIELYGGIEFAPKAHRLLNARPV